MLYGYKIKKGGSVEVETGYETKKAAIEAVKDYIKDGWDVDILAYDEEYMEEVEKEASIGKVADACKYLPLED